MKTVNAIAERLYLDIPEWARTPVEYRRARQKAKRIRRDRIKRRNSR